jgi:molybdopterin-guanine dinucleotide biosynthesis protein A
VAAAVGFVVAGGQSRRMGADKALLPWGDHALLDHALATLQAVVPDVRILCGPHPRYEDRGVPVVIDRMGAGPLAGLEAALASSPRAALLLAVDLPLVPPALLARIAELLEVDDDAAVPMVGDLPQPLCAVYRPSCLDPVRRRIAEGQLKMTAFWPEVRVRRVGAAELTGFDLDRMLRNVNTRDDYEDARRAAEAG